MSSESSSPAAAPNQVPVVGLAEPAAQSPVPARAGARPCRAASCMCFVAVAALSLAVSGMLWQKLSNIQEQLARQSADAGSNAIEARALARQAQELARETAARQALADTRLGEVALQRSQIEELMQSLSRSRDENLVVDIESALRLAQQQAQVTRQRRAAAGGAAQRRPAPGARGAAAPGPRACRDRRATSTASSPPAITDVPGLLARLDELARQVDELPLANAVPNAGVVAPAPRKQEPRRAGFAGGSVPWRDIREEARGLVRVSRIDQPEAVLLAPEQAFFLRENLKLKLLNARLALLSRQTDSARADVGRGHGGLAQVFRPGGAQDPGRRRASCSRCRRSCASVELPRIDETLAVLATAAAGEVEPTMRAALWLLALFGVAVAIALFAGNNQGTVTLFWPPYRVDLSLNLVLLLLFAAFVLLHAALRRAGGLFDLPRQALALARRSRRSAPCTARCSMRCRTCWPAASSAPARRPRRRWGRRNRWPPADMPPANAAQVRTLAHLLAAESAHALQDRPAREEHLKQALEQTSARDAQETHEGALMRAARWSLRRPGAAMPRWPGCKGLPQGAARRTLALRMKLKAARLAQPAPPRRWRRRACLSKHRAFSSGAAAEHRARTGDRSAQRRARRRAVAARLGSLEPAERAMPELADPRGAAPHHVGRRCAAGARLAAAGVGAAGASWATA